MPLQGSLLRKGFYYECAVEALPPRQSLRLQFLRIHHAIPNFKAPRTFSEKLQVRKLNELRAPNDTYTQLSDKVRVKEFVAARSRPDIVTPTLWHGRVLPPLSERTWPVPFVLKANHTSGQNVFIREEADKDWPRIEIQCRSWMHQQVPACLYERWYHRIAPQLLIEPLLADPHQGASLNDYKFFVFHGRALYVQVDTDRSTQHKRAFYDRDWVRQPFSLKFPLETRSIAKPRHLQQMLDIAEQLGAGFDFVRVDLYDLPQGPRFGEMTFAPGSGFERFTPVEYDRMFGDLW